MDPLTAAAEPNRRRILQLLATEPRTVTDIAAQFPVTRSAISQHLLVLEDDVSFGVTTFEIDRFWTDELDVLVADAQRIRRKS